MSAYESLAACYDELTYDIPYEKTLTFFERLCAREHVQPRSVLDLACGTGSLSLLLARRGYRVIGADLSSDMLAEAEQKAQALPENRPFFICQPMQRLRLAEPVVSFLSELRQLAGLEPALLQPLLRTVGIGLLTQLTASVCADAGESTVTRLIELCGSVLGIYTALPLLEAVLSLLRTMLEG